MTATRILLAFLCVAAFAVADLQAGPQTAYQNFILSKNPVGNWQFDGDATDATANGNDLTLMGNATTPGTGGAFGGALSMPGPLAPDGGTCHDCGVRISEHLDGAVVATGAGNPLNLTAPGFTLVAWVNPELEKDPAQRDASDPTGVIGTMMVVNKRRATNWTGGGGWWDYSLWMAGMDGNADTGFYQSYGFQSAGITNAADEGVILTSPANNVIPPPMSDKWTMLGMTSVSGEGTNYYINGQLTSTSHAIDTATQTGSAHELLIGARGRPSLDDYPGTAGLLAGVGDDSPGDNFIGQIDEVAIFSGAKGDRFFETAYNIWSEQVPEPGTISLLGIGGLLMMLRRRRRK